MMKSSLQNLHPIALTGDLVYWRHLPSWSFGIIIGCDSVSITVFWMHAPSEIIVYWNSDIMMEEESNLWRNITKETKA